MFGIAKLFFKAQNKLSGISGFLKPAFSIVGLTILVSQIRKFVGPYFHDMVVNHPRMGVFFYLFVASLFISVSYATITRVFGMRNRGWANKLITGSVLITALCFIVYIGLVQYKKGEDNMYPILKNIKTEQDFWEAKGKHSLNFVAEANSDPQFVHKLIAAGYSKLVYEKVFAELSGKHLNQKRNPDKKSKDGYSPLLWSIYRDNEVAARLLARNTRVNLREEFKFRPKRKQGMLGWLKKKVVGDKKGTYNAYKIAMLDGKTKFARIIKEEGLKRWTGWSQNDMVFYDDEYHP